MDILYQSLWAFSEALYPLFPLAWNLFLAVIPLFLSLLLFRRTHPSGLLWWAGLAVFVAFLPNAPYVLTDFSHVLKRLQMDPPLPFWAIAFVLLPQVTIYFFLGFQAYVIALVNLEDYLYRQRLQGWILPIELLLHWLCAIGIYLGRFWRFNSWELLSRPQAIFSAIFSTFRHPPAVTAIAIVFLILTGLYYLVRFLNLTLLRIWLKKF